MPYFKKPFEEEEGQRAQQDVGIPMQSSQGVVGNGNKPAGPSTSGSFTNLNKYLGANKEKIAGFAKTVGDRAIDDVNSAKTTIGTEKTAFNNDVADNTHQDNGLKDRALGAPSQLTDAERSRFQFNASGSYDGPNAFTSEAGVDHLDEAGQAVAATDTHTGRGTLLGKQYEQIGRPQVSSGGRKLDMWALDKPESSRKTFADLRNRIAPELQTYRDNLNSEVTSTITNARDHNSSLGETYRTDLANTRSGITTDIDGRVKSANREAEAAYRQALKDHSRNWDRVDGVAGQNYVGNIADKSVTGYNGWEGADMGDVARFVTKRGDAGWNNVMSQAEKVRANALASLAGEANQYVGDLSSLGNATTIDQGAYDAEVNRINGLADSARRAADGVRTAKSKSATEVEQYREGIRKMNNSYDWSMDTLSKMNDFVNNPNKIISVNGTKTTLKDLYSHLSPTQKSDLGKQYNKLKAANAPESVQNRTKVGGTAGQVGEKIKNTKVGGTTGSTANKAKKKIFG